MAQKLLLGSYVLQNPVALVEDEDSDSAIANSQVREASQQLFMRHTHDLGFSSLIPSMATSYEMTLESLDVKKTTTIQAGPFKAVVKPFRINKWLHRFFPKVENRAELANLWLQMENVRFPLQMGGTEDEILQEFPMAESVKMGKYIEKGAYGAIHRITWLDQEHAVKLFDEEEHLLKEAVIHFTLDHPHVVKPQGYIRNFNAQSSAERFGLIMELMEGDLQSWIDNNMEKKNREGPPLEELQAIDVMLQLATALMYMHSYGLIHRDIKPGNMLVRSSNDFSSGLEVKLGDFGIVGYDDNPKLSALAGTSCYRAPEVLQGEGGSKCFYTAKADVYSFGMTFFAVLTGQFPLGKYRELDERKLFEKVRGKSLLGWKRAGKRPRLPNRINSSLAKLIHQCWHDDPEERPPFDVICWALEIIKSQLLGLDVSSSLDRSPEVYPMKPDASGTGVFNQFFNKIQRPYETPQSLLKW